jgi:hypothetical protein
MKRLQLIFILTLLFVPIIFAQQIVVKNIKATKKDKSKILEKVFDDGFEKLITDERFSQCTIPVLNDKMIILI